MSFLSGYRGKFTQVKTAKKRKISSTRWLQRQLNDPLVQQAKLDGYHSRSAYKLIEINDKFQILHPYANVVDLGSAPGGWSQVAAKIIKSYKNGSQNKLIAIDLLPMKKIAGVTFFQENFYSSSIKELVINELNGQYVDVVLSDMAANTIGHKKTDHLKIMDLCEQALIFALQLLSPGGNFVAKIFRGGTENHLLHIVKKYFTKVYHFKPNSSRKESSEFYLVALKKK